MDEKKSLIFDLTAEHGPYFEILGEAQAMALRAGLVILPPGQDVGSHNTESYEELVIIIEGEGELEVEGAGRTKIAKGQAAFNPINTQHNIKNKGKGPLRYIYVVARAV